MRLNGMVNDQPVMKKRRGRRKNVEGMDHLFMNKNRPTVMVDQVCGMCDFFFFNFKQSKKV